MSEQIHSLIFPANPLRRFQKIIEPLQRDLNDAAPRSRGIAGMSFEIGHVAVALDDIAEKAL